MFTENVAHILAQETFNALAELLYPVHVLLVHLPLRTLAAFERWDFLVHLVVPGNISNQVLDHRKRLHRLNRDGLGRGKGIYAGFASKTRPPVHLCRARAALSGFAIPAYG